MIFLCSNTLLFLAYFASITLNFFFFLFGYLIHQSTELTLHQLFWKWVLELFILIPVV